MLQRIKLLLGTPKSHSRVHDLSPSYFTSNPAFYQSTPQEAANDGSGTRMPFTHKGDGISWRLVSASLGVNVWILAGSVHKKDLSLSLNNFQAAIWIMTKNNGGNTLNKNGSMKNTDLFCLNKFNVEREETIFSTSRACEQQPQQRTDAFPL